MKIINVNNKSYKLSLEYILGFFEGDGSITIQFKPSKSHKTGKQIVLIFEIHQHFIDVDLLKAISIFLGIGKVEIGRKVGNPETWVYRLRISSQNQILNELLPILQSHPMMLNKRNHDINLFIRACFLVKNKEHTVNQGLLQLETIRSQLSSKKTSKEKSNLPNTEFNLNSN
jgi:intein/homing endonuclease